MNQKLPMFVLAAGFAALLVAAYFLLSPGSQTAGIVPAPIVKSTISPTFSASRNPLPFAEEAFSRNQSESAFNNETQPSSGIPVVDAGPPESQSIDPSQPGNRISFNGKLITVAETRPSDHGNGRELAVDFIPASPPANPGKPASGITADEELFRAKWGWAMTDQIKTSALVETESGQ